MTKATSSASAILRCGTLGCALALVGCPEPSTPFDSGVDGGTTDTSSTSTTDGGSVASVDAFVDSLGEAACTALQACLETEFSWETNEGDASRCRAHFAVRFAYLGRLVAAGRVTFAEEAVPECLASIDAAVCQQAVPHAFDEWPAACRAMFSGAVPPGGRCDSTLECDDSRCACDGQCVAWVPLGGDCRSASCAPGLDCSAAAICEASPPPTTLARGDACTLFYDCGGLLRCVDGTCRDGRDRRTQGLGEPCDAENQLCGPNLECDFNAGSVCVGPHPAGAACDEVLTTGLCPLGTICHGPAGSATCAPRVGVGEACFAQRGEACEIGLWCHSSVCEPLLQLGEPCTDPMACYSGICDGTCSLPQYDFCP